MARARDVRMAEFRRRRRQFNDMLLKAKKEGRLDEVLREMDRRAREFMAGPRRSRSRRRTAT